MDRVTAYACRVKGDASSWRKVLTMAGFGNAGVPPELSRNMDDLAMTEAALVASTIDLDVWRKYTSTRPQIAETPQGEAALTITRNRDAIIRDTVKRAGTSPWNDSPLPKTESRC